jgi:hypothetical protein
MSRRQVQQPTVLDSGLRGAVRETHPAFGKAILNKHRHTPGAVLFDSEIRHPQTVVLTIEGATRERDLNRDWIHADSRPIVEIEMSMAQWADLISSFGNGGGVPVTIRRTQNEVFVPELPYAPRLAQSQAEVEGAADRMFEEVKAKLAAVEEKPTKANIRALRIALDNATPNVGFAAESLTEHVEKVVTKARADIEAMVTLASEHAGLEAGDRPRIAIGGDQ